MIDIDIKTGEHAAHQPPPAKIRAHEQAQEGGPERDRAAADGDGDRTPPGGECMGVSFRCLLFLT